MPKPYFIRITASLRISSYVKQYRQNIHQWSYKRLCDAISSKAAQNGIVIEYAQQYSAKTSEIPAKYLALTAYHSRKPTVS